MSFGDEIFRALTGREAEPTSPESMLNAIDDYRAEIGLSRRAFARQSGIPESTLRYWGQHGVRGRHVEENAGKLTRAYRGLIASPAALDRWRNNQMTVHLSGIPRTARDVSASKLGLRAGTGAAVVNAFLNGNDKQAAQIFARGVTDQFYRNAVFGRWLPAHDEDLSDLAYEGDGYDDADGYFAQASAS